MANFNMLPLGIISEILSLLPVESVLECKLVSKPWRNAIRHPSFSQIHLNHLDSAPESAGKSSFILYTPPMVANHTMIPNFFYTEYDESLNLFSGTRKINLSPPFQNYYILGSCNGLICFNAYDDINLGYKPAYICNPITREYIVLPKSQGKDLLTGFGYCHLTNEYKVVSICNTKEDPNFGMVQVYTLGSGVGWRNVGTMMDYVVKSGRQLGVFANGAVHWVDREGDIFVFDLAYEELRKLPSPPGLLPRLMATLFVSGNLVYAYFKYVRSWDIWTLKKNENCQDAVWSKDFSDSSRINVRPITFAKSGGLLCLNCGDKNVYCYAPDASSSRMLLNFGEKFQFGVPHTNTLVSLKVLGEQDTKLMDSGESSDRLPAEEKEEKDL